MKTKGEDAETLLYLLDGPMQVHQKWRERTHAVKAAAKVAMIAALTSETKKYNYQDFFHDAMTHLFDDELFNKMKKK